MILDETRQGCAVFAHEKVLIGNHWIEENHSSTLCRESGIVSTYSILQLPLELTHSVASERSFHRHRNQHCTIYIEHNGVAGSSRRAGREPRRRAIELDESRVRFTYHVSLNTRSMERWLTIGQNIITVAEMPINTFGRHESGVLMLLFSCQ